MSISKDLFLAIFSMDAYNRGYGAEISDGGDSDTDGLGVSTPSQDYFIGNAKIIDSKGDAESQSASFYAIAYEITDGTRTAGLATGDTIIS